MLLFVSAKLFFVRGDSLMKYCLCWHYQLCLSMDSYFFSFFYWILWFPKFFSHYPQPPPWRPTPWPCGASSSSSSSTSSPRPRRHPSLRSLITHHRPARRSRYPHPPPLHLPTPPANAHRCGRRRGRAKTTATRPSHYTPIVSPWGDSRLSGQHSQRQFSPNTHPTAKISFKYSSEK